MLVGVLILPLLLRYVPENRNRVALVFYVMAVLVITLGVRSFDNDSQVVLNPFRAYRIVIRAAVDGFKLGGLPMMRRCIGWYRKVIEDIGLNMLLFVPLGYLLPRVIKMDLGKMVLAGFILSLTIETTQLITHLGWFDTSDLLHNSLGTVIGFRYYKFLEKRKCSQS